MSKFVYIFRGGGRTAGLSPTQMQAHVAKWRSWLDELSARTPHDGGVPLDNPGKTLRGRDRVVTDGPYAESKDMVTGSLVVEAASLEEAAEWARGCPVFEFDGSVEVRPVFSRAG